MAWTLGDAQTWIGLEEERSTAGLPGWQRHHHSKWLKWARGVVDGGLVPPEVLFMDSPGTGLYVYDTTAQTSTLSVRDLEHLPGDVADPGYNPFNRG